MEEAVSFIQYLQAAYLDNELQVSPATADFVHSDIAHCPQPPSSLHASLFISLDQPSELIQIDISLFPFDVPPKPPTLYIRQPNFLSRAQHEQLCSSLSSVNTADDLYLVIEEIKPAFDTLLGQIKLATQDQCSSDIQPKYTGQMIRAWFWFITISTPEKRNDIVQCAPNYGLTGFLLAGKPGLMCLEGPTDAIDAFWKEIKTTSWAEIPSGHKKVTERDRENIQQDGSNRAFDKMIEIDVARRGSRGHRGDMSELQEWMKEHGVGDAFNRVMLSSLA